MKHRSGISIQDGGPPPWLRVWQNWVGPQSWSPGARFAIADCCWTAGYGSPEMLGARESRASPICRVASGLKCMVKM